MSDLDRVILSLDLNYGWVVEVADHWITAIQRCRHYRYEDRGAVSRNCRARYPEAGPFLESGSMEFIRTTARNPQGGIRLESSQQNSRGHRYQTSAWSRIEVELDGNFFS